MLQIQLIYSIPRKKPPPWKGANPESKKAEEALATTSIVWFVEKYPDSPLASSVIKTSQLVEISLRMRFPKCPNDHILSILASGAPPLPTVLHHNKDNSYQF
jgi:hypothetical protein